MEKANKYTKLYTENFIPNNSTGLSSKLQLYNFPAVYIYKGMRTILLFVN